MTDPVYLVRHGQTPLNAEGRLRGRLDPPLDEIGEHQVELLGLAFASLSRRPGRVVAGPLLRTRETASAIAEPCGLEPVVDERLIDRDYGPWTGEPAHAVKARWGPDLIDLPGAEPVKQVVERAVAVLMDQLEDLSRPVVLVTHDAVSSHLLHALDPSLGPAHEIRQDTACWNQLHNLPDGWHVAVVNGDASSLRERA